MQLSIPLRNKCAFIAENKFWSQMKREYHDNHDNTLLERSLFKFEVHSYN